MRLVQAASARAPSLALAVGVAALVTCLPQVALGTPNHAHLHYHIGVRAYAGTRHAAMLHLEASSEGLDPVLARENARDMERLATEILEQVNRLEEVMSPREREAIASEVAGMKEHGAAARRLSAELAGWIEEAGIIPEKGGAPRPVPPALRERIAGRARVLFAEFSLVLARHKEAEKKLSIPAPPDPPAP